MKHFINEINRQFREKPVSRSFPKIKMRLLSSHFFVWTFSRWKNFSYSRRECQFYQRRDSSFVYAFQPLHCQSYYFEEENIEKWQQNRKQFKRLKGERTTIFKSVKVIEEFVREKFELSGNSVSDENKKSCRLFKLIIF